MCLSSICVYFVWNTLSFGGIFFSFELSEFFFLLSLLVFQLLCCIFQTCLCILLIFCSLFLFFMLFFYSSLLQMEKKASIYGLASYFSNCSTHLFLCWHCLVYLLTDTIFFFNSLSIFLKFFGVFMIAAVKCYIEHPCDLIPTWLRVIFYWLSFYLHVGCTLLLFCLSRWKFNIL